MVNPTQASDMLVEVLFVDEMGVLLSPLLSLTRLCPLKFESESGS